MILAQAAGPLMLSGLYIHLGFAVAGSAQVVTSGLVLHLDAGDNPLGGSVNPAEWGDISGANVLPGAGSSPARLTANPNDPRRAVDAVTRNAFYTVTDTGPANFGLSGDPPSSSEPELFVSSFTIELWLRQAGPAFSGEHQMLGLRAEQHIQRFSLALSIPDNNLLFSEFSAPGFFNAGGVDTGVLMPIDTNFHHLAVTFDNTGGIIPNPPMNVYLDNVVSNVTLLVTAALQDVIDPSGPDPIDWIGLEFPWSSVFTAFNLEASRRFNGDISVVRIYDRALSAAEVTQNFTAGIPTVADALTTVPDVVGDPLATASNAIVAANLQVGNVTINTHPTIAAGSVISTAPAAGAQVFTGEQVDILESFGIGNLVPDVLGDTLSVASNAIVAAGLTVGNVTTDHNNDHPKDTVGAVNPGVGTGHLPDAPVNIVISFGPLDYDTVAIGDATVVSYTGQTGKVYQLWSGIDSNDLSFTGIQQPGDGGTQNLFDPTVNGGVDTGMVYGVTEN